jgi:hypothetical protein
VQELEERDEAAELSLAHAQSAAALQSGLTSSLLLGSGSSSAGAHKVLPHSDTNVCLHGMQHRRICLEVRCSEGAGCIIRLCSPALHCHSIFTLINPHIFWHASCLMIACVGNPDLQLAQEIPSKGRASIHRFPGAAPLPSL